MTLEEALDNVTLDRYSVKSQQIDVLRLSKKSKAELIQAIRKWAIDKAPQTVGTDGIEHYPPAYKLAIELYKKGLSE